MRENSDDYRTISLTEVIAHSSPIQALDPALFIVRARYELLGLLVERVLQGERFLAFPVRPVPENPSWPAPSTMNSSAGP